MNPSPLELEDLLAAAAEGGDVQARTFLYLFESFTARLGQATSDPGTTLTPGGDKQVRLGVSKAPERCPTSAS